MLNIHSTAQVEQDTVLTRIYGENGYEYFRGNEEELVARKETDDFRVDFEIDEEENVVTTKQTCFKNAIPDEPWMTLVVSRKYKGDKKHTRYFKNGHLVSQPVFWLLKNSKDIQELKFEKVISSLFSANDSVGEKLLDPLVGHPAEVPYWE
jgi:hypothetical protein